MSGTAPEFPRIDVPHYAVIFSSRRTDGDLGYDAMAEKMVELAARQPGFLGVESVRDSNGFGITVSYWESEAAIRRWRENVDHLEAQDQGRKAWYSEFSVRIARVERVRHWERA